MKSLECPIVLYEIEGGCSFSQIRADAKSYGLMIGGQAAVEFMDTACREAVSSRMEKDPEFANLFECAFHRFAYEIDKATPVPVTERKGRRTDYSCGNCGRGADVNDKYCSGCGTLIDWQHPKIIKLT